MNKELQQKKNKRVRTFSGIVVSDSMQKTIVVRVDRVRIHRLYGKRSVVGKRFKVHDEKGQYKVGDTVSFAECRPFSKEKRWRVIY